MDVSKLDLSKYMNVLSTRHHYLPQFLLKGFANSDGLLFIYDKRQDKILKKARPPKSIFFENNRNTIEINEETKSSILEDVIYKDIDDKTCQVIKKYQSEKLEKIDFNSEETAKIISFLQFLFWRIPKTDNTVNDLIDRATNASESINFEFLRNDEVFRKFQRIYISAHSLREFKNSTQKKWVNLHQNNNSIYVIGDYPIVFRKAITKFSDFNDIDYLFAFSANRIYSSTKEALNEFPAINSLLYNLCVITQSENYVASGDFILLKQMVKSYKELQSSAYAFNENVFIFSTI